MRVTSPVYLKPRASTVQESSPRRHGGHGASAAEFEHECVQFFAEVVQIFGVPKSVGQIYGILYAAPEPLSFSDIVARLEISKGSVSQGLALLRALGAINDAKYDSAVDSGRLILDGQRPEHERRRGSRHAAAVAEGQASADPPSRRLAYEPELSLRRLVSGILKERIAPLAAMGAARLSRIRGLAEQRLGETSFYLDRAKQLSTWRRRLKIILPLLGTLLGPKSRK